MYDRVGSNIKNRAQGGGCVVGNRHQLDSCTRVGKLERSDYRQQFFPALVISTGDPVRNADRAPGHRRGKDGGSAQNFEHLGVTQIAPPRQNVRRRNDFRWNAERGETIGEPLCETAYTAHFLPAGDQNLGRSFNLHLPLSVKSHGSVKRVVAGGPQVTERW